jgi:hypothetical protein
MYVLCPHDTAGGKSERKIRSKSIFWETLKILVKI